MCHREDYVPLILEQLKLARELLSDEKHWVQGSLANDAEGSPLVTSGRDRAYTEQWSYWNEHAGFSTPPTPVCFCMHGALLHVRSKLSPLLSDERKSRLYELCVAELSVAAGTRVRGYDIAGFNDSEKTTHADVLQVFDKAIKAIEKQLPA